MIRDPLHEQDIKQPDYLEVLEILEQKTANSNAKRKEILKDVTAKFYLSVQSKSNIAKFLKISRSFMYLLPKKSSFSKRVSRV